MWDRELYMFVLKKADSHNILSATEFLIFISDNKLPLVNESTDAQNNITNDYLFVTVIEL